MNKKLLGLLAVLVMFAGTALSAKAAGLTTGQANSLIGVVQSSPGTPASAFVNLITAFSNITTNQATSLIAVVQASPSTPATAFIDLLTSFTVDTTATRPATPATNQLIMPTTTSSITPVATFTPQTITLGDGSTQTTTNDSVIVDKSILVYRYKTFFPKGLHGTVDFWSDTLVRQDGMDMNKGGLITYSLDGVVIGSTNGMPNGYTFPVDTTKYTNGTHQLTISADDGRGDTAESTLAVDIEN